MAKRANQPSDRERFDKLFADGNFKDAYDGYRRLALDPKTEPNRVATDLRQAVLCLTGSGDLDEADAFLEQRSPPTRGTGGFSRQPPRATCPQSSTTARSWPESSAAASRANGRPVGCYERDRVRAIQLLTRGN